MHTHQAAGIRRPGYGWALVAVMLLTAALYWPGLRGPYLIDDIQHLALIDGWLRGFTDIRDVLFGNTNPLMHRTLAMGSLAMSGWIGGHQPFSYKLGNLLIHLLCAGIAYRALVLMLARDPRLAGNARLIAATVCAIWLVHPLNVSTVLYSVQRMAQVATLFCLLGAWFYAHTRTRMQDGALSPRAGAWMIWIGIPLATLLGIEGKQNAAILPLLCLVIELAWFARGRPMPRPLRVFYLVAVAVPGVLTLSALAWKWDAIDALTLDFGMHTSEHLLSEPRVLWDYIRLIVLPYSPAMGLFVDDYPISTGLFSPVTTAPAIAALLGTSLLAWRLRNRMPAVFAGWFWFLAAHSVESSFLPLEVYYEHRNYLPAFGLLLACAAIVHELAGAASRRGLASSRIVGVLVVGFMLVLCVQTFGRVLVWQRALSITMAGVETHPYSVRANWAHMRALLDAGQTREAYESISRLANSAPDPGTRALGMLGRITLNCMFFKDAAPAELEDAVRLMPDRVNVNTPYIVGSLVMVRRDSGCGRIDARTLARAIQRMADKAPKQTDAAPAKWPMRYNAAIAYAQAGQWDEALAQARLGWQPTADPSTADVLVAALLHARQPEEAERIISEAAARSYTLARSEEVLRVGGGTTNQLRSMIIAYKSSGRLPDAP